MTTNKNFELFGGCLGNGITLANMAEIENGDYKTIGHISPGGKITWYVEENYIKLKYPYTTQKSELQKQSPVVDILKRVRKLGPSSKAEMKSHLPGRSQMKKFVSEM